MPTHELRILDLTLPTPAENLACDEALLDWGEASGGEVLRFWEPNAARPPRPPVTTAGSREVRQVATAVGDRGRKKEPRLGLTCFVVLGQANRAGTEVDQAACAEDGVRIYRRCTGGGTVLQGPGCFNYSLVLQIGRHPDLAGITSTNRYIMERHRAAVEVLLAAGRESHPFRGSRSDEAPSEFPLCSEPPQVGCYHRAEPVAVLGHTDLALGGRKFSGNAQRRKRWSLLFHGTFLSPALLRQALARAWQADGLLEEWPERQTRQLASEKYETKEWNLKF
jgi:lipoate---protein ligase